MVPDYPATFIDNVQQDGGVVSSLFWEQFNSLPAKAQTAKVILVPGAGKTGKVYGYDPTTGNFVPFTFSRSSTGTYIDASGQMQTAAVNVPRIHYQNGKPGFLMERAATNLCRYSNSFVNWGGGPIRTEPSAVLTSYGKPFTKIKKAAATTSEAVNSVARTTSATTRYVARVTLRAATSTAVQLGIGPVTDPADGGGLWGANVNGTWKKISGPGTVTQAQGALITVSGLTADTDTVVEISRYYITAGLTFQYYFYPGLSSSTTIGASVLASCVMMEVGEQCTSYVDVPANVDVTRSADVFASDADIVPYSAATVYTDFAVSSQDLTGTSTILVSKGLTGRFIYYPDDAGSMLYNYDGTVGLPALNSIGQFKLGQNSKFVTSYNSSPANRKVAFKGLLYSGGYDGDFGSGVLKLNEAASIKDFYSHFRSLCIFDSQLTDQEHRDLSL